MRLLITLLTVTLLSGCSSLKFWESDDEVDELAPAELVDLDEEVKVKKLWSRGVGSHDALYANLVPIFSEGVIYGADDDGDVVAVNASSGKVLWKEDVKANLSGGVGAGGGLVTVAGSEGRVFALDSGSGNIRWKTSVSLEILSAPASNGSEVVVQSLDGFLVGLSGASGAELWRYRSDIPSLTLRARTSPVISGNTVVAGFANGKIVALDTRSGSLLWENRVALPKGRSELERMVDIAGSPVLVGDIVYATSYHGRAAAIVRGTGRSLWYQDMSSIRQPGIGQDQVYITLENDEVKALRANSGQEMWTNARMKYRKLSAPAYAGGYVAVGDSEGYLHVLSATDGRMVGRKKIDGSGIDAPMLSDGNILYVFDNSGGVTAVTFEPR
jgi:outer membrane protein assembly factor BamB